MSRQPHFLLLLMLLLSCTDSHNHDNDNTGLTAPASTSTGAAAAIETAASESTLPTLSQAVFTTRYGKAEFYCQVLGSIGVFTGQSNNLHGQVDLHEQTLDFYLPLETLRTGIGQRDRDMHKLLRIDKHPQARFTGTLDTVFDPLSSEIQPVNAIGEFYLNGREQPLRVEGFMQRDGDGIRLQARWILNIADFGLNPPATFLMDINNDLEISISGRLIPPRLAGLP